MFSPISSDFHCVSMHCNSVLSGLMSAKSSVKRKLLRYLPSVLTPLSHSISLNTSSNQRANSFGEMVSPCRTSFFLLRFYVFHVQYVHFRCCVVIYVFQEIYVSWVHLCIIQHLENCLIFYQVKSLIVVNCLFAQSMTVHFFCIFYIYIYRFEIQYNWFLRFWCYLSPLQTFSW